MEIHHTLDGGAQADAMRSASVPTSTPSPGTIVRVDHHHHPGVGFVVHDVTQRGCDICHTGALVLPEMRGDHHDRAAPIGDAGQLLRERPP